MGHKHWTPREINYVAEKALLDSTNAVVNIKQMSKYLKRSTGAINNQITKLRKAGKLPQIERDKAIDTSYRPYTEDEIKRVKYMFQKDSTVKEIANALDRTESAIQSLIFNLRKKGVIESRKKEVWQQHEEIYVLNNIKFDEHGFTTNTEEMANFLEKSVQSVSRKITKLRQNGAITIHADRTKTSVKAKKAHEQFNNKRFAGYERKVPVVVNTPSKVEVVQVVLTVTVGAKGEEIQQYWTFDGKLLAENKRPTEGNQ
ncbi:hypothetical protein GY31_03375 [Lysinibacillus sphaericus]|uniref:hypothetical protein n=1 Tax=Lysinibacillus TaxID=400634 RepID=UPI00084B423E|nr:hypothetical protein [Lysinibacillus sphaericus]OEC03160.1 hypothetical protein GY31_03375 [Lysinibacillus sphaericus]